MNQKIVYNQYKKSIQLHKVPLGKGAEGEVFKVKSDIYKNAVIKIYYPEERSFQKLAKIQYLIQNLPEFQDEFTATFPQEVIYNEEEEFIGFLMPEAPGEFDLTSLCSLKPSFKLSEAWREKYNRDTAQGLNNRIKLCHNIAVAFHQIHCTRRYVLIDIKPENIRVSLQGQITILDIDSIGVIENKKMIFPPEKLTLEYAPPEVKSLDFKKDIMDESWDNFSLAVIFYKLLLGLHPFAVSGKGKLLNLTSLAQKTQAGLFPFGKNKRQLQVIPPPHLSFKELPVALQKLFLCNFDTCLFTPIQRPAAYRWMQKLRNTEVQDAVADTSQHASSFSFYQLLLFSFWQTQISHFIQHSKHLWEQIISGTVTFFPDYKNRLFSSLFILKNKKKSSSRNSFAKTKIKFTGSPQFKPTPKYTSYLKQSPYYAKNNTHKSGKYHRKRK